MKIEELKMVYINLDSRTDREAHMQETIKNSGLPLQRVRAIPYTECDTANSKHQKMMLRTPGALGCHISQTNCIREALAEGKDLLLCEDDIVFSSDIKERLQIVSEFCNTHEWDVMNLGGTVHVDFPRWHDKGHTNSELKECSCTLERDLECTDNKHIYRVYGMWSTYCWLINHKSMEKLLALFEEHIKTSIGIDWLMIRLAPQLKCYAFLPGSAKQIDSQSSIGDGVTFFSAFHTLGAHWFQDKLSDFDSETYNWGEAKIK